MLGRRVKRAALGHPIVFVAGVFAFVNGVILTAFPEDLVEGSIVLNEWLPWARDFAWPITYGIAGALMLWGLIFRQPAKEAAGLVLFAFAVLTYSFAIWNFADYDPFTVIIPLSLHISLGLGAAGRAFVLARSNHG